MSPLARVLRLLVRAYRAVVSPLLPPRCRFAPTCSQYAIEAIEVHGALRGGWLAVRRVARCHPFHPGGHDPVPARRHAADASRVSDDGSGAAGPAARTAVRSSVVRGTARPTRAVTAPVLGAPS